MKESLSEKLKILPSVEEVLLFIETHLPSLALYSRSYIAYEVRSQISELRTLIKSGEMDDGVTRDTYLKIISEKAGNKIQKREHPQLRKVINGTGVILHTGLGRAPLSSQAVRNLQEVLSGYSLLEFDISSGRRGNRQAIVARLLTALFDCGDAAVVNNNAAAVFIVLNSLAEGRETVVSRGQQVEIGGSFRMPDIMWKSHTIMREVGTTNKTRLKDYEFAINENTGLLLDVHTSNYRVSGFVETVPLKDLARLGKKYKIPVAFDLGSGVMNDFSAVGLPYEPTVGESLKTGANVVMFSGDKVFGGPQCGIILGKQDELAEIKSNPLMRAVRCDKMTLAALEGTLKVYLKDQSQWERVPAYKMITEDNEAVENRVNLLLEKISPEILEKFNIKGVPLQSQVGSGAFPVEKVSGFGLEFSSKAADITKIAAYFRTLTPPIIGYIQKEKFYLNFRTITLIESETVIKAVNRMYDAG